MKTEREMAAGVVRYFKSKGKVACTEVPLASCRLDVVAYDRKGRIFKVVECKTTKRVTSIGRTFGQLATYISAVRSNPLKFLDATSEKLPRMPFQAWMEASGWGRRFRVEFYVGLTQDACRQTRLLQELKSFLPKVGIIRMKNSGHGRSYLLIDGKSDRGKISGAKPITFRIRRP